MPKEAVVKTEGTLNGLVAALVISLSLGAIGSCCEKTKDYRLCRMGDTMGYVPIDYFPEDNPNYPLDFYLAQK